MEENPNRASPENGTQKISDHAGRRKSVSAIDEGDLIDCSGKHCRSCTGGAVADCVAICCCPCAVMSILALAFVKLPLMVGRKCLRLKKKNKKRAQKTLEEKKKCRRNSGSCNGKWVDVEKNENMRKVKVDPGEDGEGDEGCGGSTRLEMEKIWLELYDEVGHFGFGRVSFTAIPGS